MRSDEDDPEVDDESTGVDGDEVAAIGATESAGTNDPAARAARTTRASERTSDLRGFDAEARERVAYEAERAATARDTRADRRDGAAVKRDTTADHSDDVADERDAAVAEHVDKTTSTVEPRPHPPIGGLLKSVAADRDSSKDDRAASADDRAASADDRDAAADDRQTARAIHEASHFDDLTATMRRGPGLLELEREVGQAQREGRPLVVAVVDLVGLKSINDESGHLRGDQALRQVADALRAYLRPYDLIVRFGGDEFVCGLDGLNIAEARVHFADVHKILAASPVPTAVTVGFAELRPDDTVDALIDRADTMLYQLRDGSSPDASA